MYNELTGHWRTYFNAIGISSDIRADNYGHYLVLPEFNAACVIFDTLPKNTDTIESEVEAAARLTGKDTIFVLDGLPSVMTYPAYKVAREGDDCEYCQYCEHSPHEGKRKDPDSLRVCKEWSWVLARCRDEYGRLWGDFGEGPEEYQHLSDYSKNTGSEVAKGLRAVQSSLMAEIVTTEDDLASKRKYVDFVEEQIADLESSQPWLRTGSDLVRRYRREHRVAASTRFAGTLHDT